MFKRKLFNRRDYIPSLTNRKDSWDYILAADVVWVDYLIEPLVDSISGKFRAELIIKLFNLINRFGI